MHEALISRGQVRGHPQQDLIYDRRNCVLRHHEDSKCVHTPGVGGDRAFEICARHLVEWEGMAAVQAWLWWMKDVFPIVGEQALSRFESLIFSIQEEVEDEVHGR